MTPCGVSDTICQVRRASPSGRNLSEALRGMDAPQENQAAAPPLSESIRAARIAAEMTQLELAERVRVTRVTVSNWERGKHAPAAGQLQDLAAALGTTASDLLEGRAALRIIAGDEAAAEREDPRVTATGELLGLYDQLWDGNLEELVRTAQRMVREQDRDKRR